MTTPTSPKVTASTAAVAVTTIVLWLLAQVPFIAGAPEGVQAALALLVLGGVTWAAGYFTRDPLRTPEVEQP